MNIKTRLSLLFLVFLVSTHVSASNDQYDCVTYGNSLFKFQEKINFDKQLVDRILTSIEFYSQIRNHPTIMEGYAKNYLLIHQLEGESIGHSQLNAAEKLLDDQINNLLKRRYEFEKLQSQLNKIETKWAKAKNYFRNSCVLINQVGVYAQVLNSNKVILMGCYEDLWWQLQKDIDLRNKQMVIDIESNDRKWVGDFSLKGLLFTWQKGEYQMSLDDNFLAIKKESFLKQCVNPTIKISRVLPEVHSTNRYNF